jgi:hypothetical protein
MGAALKNSESETTCDIPTSLARETAFDLNALDGKKIRVWRNLAADNPAQKAVILAHGLTGNPHEYLHMAARDYFNNKGYDVFRLSFYSGAPAYRVLPECTLDIHAKDLNIVVGHVRNSYKKVYVCGHSYGGLTLLIANPNADAVSFWDASFTPYKGFWKSDSPYIPELDCYTIGWGSANLIGKAMFKEAIEIDEKAEDIAAAFRRPAQVILAGESNENPVRTHLFDALSGVEKSFEDIKGATHCFTDGWIAQTLYQKTHEWFERF